MTACDLVMVGCSLGGLVATKILLSGVDDQCDVPIVVIQHREQDAEGNMDGVLRNIIRGYVSRDVEEAEDKTKIRRNHIYLAPPDYHLLIEGDHICLSADEPVAFARPSIDVAFETAARSFGSAVVGVILTGASKDGANGAACIEARGGLVIVQEPSSAENSTMPKAAIASTKASLVMELDEIGPYLSRLAVDSSGGQSVNRISD